MSSMPNGRITATIDLCKARMEQEAMSASDNNFDHIHTHWLITSAEISKCGKFMQVKFKSTLDYTTHSAQVSADTWLGGIWAERKLAEFQDALKEATKLLEGRR